ncbi:PAAR domain-containing protein [Enterobacter bugandensis]|uniref:PAAR domain-containing protein n=1 Tax=Enterobacter TaxID=547 RepID=UPI000F81C626|nr:MULTISPECIES: PAAR domain-containing protein [Enterobacter]ELF8871549.1 PAAR domain-containing protein [Enterobacter bugandensis]ELQ3994698.1 PAAR domain-containing protein [Enterobacter bugandensis]ELV3039256.1 PAAR domain-containing protein [Enterobacter bugandensis]ELX8412529.1 PAAR domain-containing protein [Enterobacter bugandensis]MBT1786607.1 hypothetical protein [Enterobacter bugandensis]
MDQQYSNELTPEIVAELEMSPFTAEEIAAMDQDSRAIIAEEKALEWKHPVNAIWRIATEGNITRCGGIVAPVERESKLLLDNGRYASIATAGDIVTCPDGSTATIATSAGATSMCNGADVALVDSLLDNGDEIISTPQRHTYLVTREGITSGADFLTVTGA